MAELKTQKNDGNVDAFLNSVENEKKREDSFTILALMKKITRENPTMWGDSMIGFGSVKYYYSSGKEGEWFPVGFSPRKQNITLYLYGLSSSLDTEDYLQLMARFGKHKTGKGCIYINKLEDIDIGVLEELIRLSIREK